MPKESPQDPQVDRDVLMLDECSKILVHIKFILEEWSQEKTNIEEIALLEGP